MKRQAKLARNLTSLVMWKLGARIRGRYGCEGSYFTNSPFPPFDHGSYSRLKRTRSEIGG